MLNWYFLGVTENSIAEFGPFPTEERALLGKMAAEISAGNLRDGIQRWFSEPYKRDNNA